MVRTTVAYKRRRAVVISVGVVLAAWLLMAVGANFQAARAGDPQQDSLAADVVDHLKSNPQLTQRLAKAIFGESPEADVNRLAVELRNDPCAAELAAVIAAFAEYEDAVRKLEECQSMQSPM